MKLSRRYFLASLIALVSAASFAQRAPHLPRVGVLLTSPGPFDYVRDALKELGYVEGKTILFEAREGRGQPEELSKNGARTGR
jgi:hypothetical protein